MILINYIFFSGDPPKKIYRHITTKQIMKKTLSKRESQVLRLLLAEYEIKEISHLLNVSYSRVHDIKRVIFKKWEVKSMIGLTKEAIRRGFVDFENDNFETTHNSSKIHSFH